MLTDGMTSEQVIEFAKNRAEFPWRWNIFVKEDEAKKFASSNGLQLKWDEPITPDDWYIVKSLAKGWIILECAWLGEACIHPTTNDYPFDFSYCVKVELLPTE